MEITTVIGCRVYCDFCPQDLLMKKYGELNNKKITIANPFLMTLETFKICIDKIPTHCELYFSGMAEPFLNPQCVDMILYAYSKNFSISIYTTLVGLKEIDIEKIKHIPFLQFHIHLADKEKFAKIAITEEYLMVLKKLIQDKISNLTFMSMGSLPEKIHQIIASSIDPDVMVDRAGNNELGIHSTNKIGSLTCSAAYKNNSMKLDNNVLMPNGDVQLCCMDYGYDYTLGNLLNNDYDWLHKNDNYQNIIKRMESQGDDIICRKCNMAVSSDTIKNITTLFICNQCACPIDFSEVAGYRHDGKGICKLCYDQNLQ